MDQITLLFGVTSGLFAIIYIAYLLPNLKGQDLIVFTLSGIVDAYLMAYCLHHYIQGV